ncbi:MAG: alpha/beta fold hydrolase [Parvularculaceae bacterium]
MFRNAIFSLVALALVAGFAGSFVYWRGQQTVETAGATYLTADDRLMTIAGANVRVRIEGPPEAPPIILLHGFIYSLESFDAWAADLKRDHRVIRFDLLGHGLSGPDPERRYAPQERADFVGDVMDALAIDRAIVAGNSLGGLAAWRFAATAPDRVAALILISPGGYPDKGVAETPLSPPAPVAFFLRNASEAGVTFTMQSIYADKAEITPDRVKRTADMMRQPGNGEAYVQSIEEFTLPDPDPLLKAITASTLILWGADDKVITADHGRRMASAIPDGRLLIYDGVGHVAHEEAPEKTLGDVRDFLESVEGGAP